MKREEAEFLNRVNAQIEALHSEISLLSKKSPNDGVNKFKLKFINSSLEDANKLLKDENRPFSDFEVFDENDLPTNSDVTMILAQYLGCIEELRSANIVEYMEDEWYWVINGKKSNIRTSPPKKLRR